MRPRAVWAKFPHTELARDEKDEHANGKAPKGPIQEWTPGATDGGADCDLLAVGLEHD